MKTKKCECCQKVLEKPIGGQKYCTNCALYINRLRRQLSAWKLETKRLRTEKYGQESGNERVR